MLSVKSDRPIDSLTINILREVDRVTKTLKVDYFVAGAIARDILLTHVFGIDTDRATRDIDLAIAVESWAQFETIKENLLGTGHFTAARGVAHRLYYRANSRSHGYPLDIIPFGGVESPSMTLAWPPHGDTVLNVIGYREVLTSAAEVKVTSDFVVRIASLPGLVVLKLFAWADRGNANTKDASDLMAIFLGYAAAGNLDRLYTDAIAVLEVVDYDVDLAGPRLGYERVEAGEPYREEWIL